MTVMLLTEHHLECQSLKGGCTGSFESTLVKKKVKLLEISCGGSNNNGADSTVWIRRLICAFVVYMQQSQVSSQEPNVHVLS